MELLHAQAEQHFTRPPGRFTEAGLVKALEELGIGRPSTYASTLSVLQVRLVDDQASDLNGGLSDGETVFTWRRGEASTFGEAKSSSSAKHGATCWETHPAAHSASNCGNRNLCRASMQTQTSHTYMPSLRAVQSFPAWMSHTPTRRSRTSTALTVQSFEDSAQDRLGSGWPRLRRARAQVQRCGKHGAG